MLRSKIRTLLALGLPAASILASAPAFAQETDSAQAPPGETASAFDNSFTFVDLFLTGGYSTSPFLDASDDEDGGSSFARVSVNAVHNIVGARGSTQLTAFAEQGFYFGSDRDGERVFSVGASTNQQVSERTSVYGSINGSLDIGGQLSSRFLILPAVPTSPDPTVPPPLLVDDPDLFVINQRRYRLSGQAGVSTRVSERGTVLFSAGASRNWYSGEFPEDQTGLFGSLGYDHALNERTGVGGRVNVNRTSYDGDGGETLVINPEATVRTRLSEVWDATLAAGVVFSKVDRDATLFGDDDGDDWSTDFSLSGTLCRQSEFEQICGALNRSAQSSAIGDIATVTSASLSWYRRLDANQTVALSAGLTRQEIGVEDGEDFRTTNFQVGANYDRKVSGRLFVGASATVRKLTQNGTDPDTDLSGSVYLRYRLGDLL
jgi:hypothetical protein